MAKSPRRLGRGLSSIIPESIRMDHTGPDLDAPGHPAATTDRDGGLARSTHRIADIPLDRVKPNPQQPRRRFDEERLRSLAASLLQQGPLQPIVVRPCEDGYELIAGERRLRASKIAALATIPAIIRHVDDRDLLELALIENLQREDLNPVERARAYRRFHVEHGMSHEEIAGRTGDERATVTNYIRLLGLAEGVLQMLEEGRIGMGHGRAILGLEDKAAQLAMAKRLEEEGWSVRRLEAEVARIRDGGEPKSPGKPVSRPAVRDMEDRLAAAVGVRVRIKEGRRRHTGQIVLDYYSLDDFERIVMRLGLPDDAEI